MKSRVRAFILFLAGIAPAFLVSPAKAWPIFNTIENSVVWATSYASFTSVTSSTFDPSGLMGIGVSTNTNLTPNIFGFKFWILPVGSSCTFTISQTTQTYSKYAIPVSTSYNNSYPGGIQFQPPSISTSTPIQIPAAPIGATMKDAYYGTFEALTINPYFNLSGLSTAATYYIGIDYGRQRNSQ